MNNSKLFLDLISIPSKIGVYQFYDKKNQIIYIGKSKNLKKRVCQYFQKNENKKIEMMVSKTYRVKTIISESEFDALLLENNLIKKFQPKYNILLKDDKKLTWIVITKESFPRIFSTRNKINSQNEYFGPYIDKKKTNFLINFIRSFYFIRSCNLDLSKNNIKKKNLKFV